MKLKKISLNAVAKAELNEKEMLRILGGGVVGCCQCGCKYAGSGGGSSTSSNDKANNAKGYTSDGSLPCCPDNTGGSGTKPSFPGYTLPPIDEDIAAQESVCPGKRW